MPDYDSEDGIREYIKTFKGLHDLRKARHDAGYNRNERLNQWMILGHFFTDSIGNFGVMKISDYKDFSAFVPSLSDVIRADIFYKVFKDLDYSWGMGQSIPPLDAKCEYCNESWDVSNAHDSYYVRSYRPLTNDPVYNWFHIGCKILSNELESMKYYSDLASKIGLTKSPITLIPNEYFGSKQNDPYCSPWGLIKTPKGDIKVGWRKRVINIDWKDLYDKALTKTSEHDYETRIKIRESFYGENLFANEDVTKGTHMIHAWSSEKAVEYLEKICEAFGVRMEKK